MPAMDPFRKSLLPLHPRAAQACPNASQKKVWLAHLYRWTQLPKQSSFSPTTGGGGERLLATTRKQTALSRMIASVSYHVVTVKHGQVTKAPRDRLLLRTSVAFLLVFLFGL
jgi:hypothetical protein